MVILAVHLVSLGVILRYILSNWVNPRSWGMLSWWFMDPPPTNRVFGLSNHHPTMVVLLFFSREITPSTLSHRQAQQEG